MGKKWLYDDSTRGTVCSATGCSQDIFGGRSVLLVDSQLTIQSEPASRLRQFRVAHDGELRVETIYLAQRSSGLAKFSTGANVWRSVLSTTSISVSNGAYVLAGGPHHSAPHLLSAGQASVPAGNYSVVWSEHDFTQTGQFAPEDIFEHEEESFADGVGVVSALQTYSFDDNDPQGIDIFAYVRHRLLAVDAFPLPVVVSEAEPNDTGTTARPALADSAIVSANVVMTDPAAILAGTVINPDSLGVRRVQDWYRFVAPRTVTLIVRLVPEKFNVDLDVYLLRPGATTYLFVASSVNPAGQSEAMSVAVTAGVTYYIAVQAWNTAGGGRTNYWMYVR